MSLPSFTDRARAIISSIPHGYVATYGQIAAMAGNRRAARQVVRVLHTCSQSHNLPWHRVVNREGRIALRAGSGFHEQQRLLAAEGIAVDESGVIDLEIFLWRPVP